MTEERLNEIEESNRLWFAGDGDHEFLFEAAPELIASLREAYASLTAKDVEIAGMRESSLW